MPVLQGKSGSPYAPRFLPAAGLGTRMKALPRAGAQRLLSDTPPLPVGRATPLRAEPSYRAAPAAKLRVLVADDHPLVREGLRSLLAMQPDFVLVGEAHDGATAIQLATELKPDI